SYEDTLRSLRQAQNARKGTNTPESTLERHLQAFCKWHSEPILPANATDPGPSFIVGQAMQRYARSSSEHRDERLGLLNALSRELHGVTQLVYAESFNSALQQMGCLA
ncbi:MAG: hypothetical protein EBZ48_13505, partial [Proteobacteria bacterium]|nr:hypothetical protein [Pseudomonadota bacterium]